MANRPIEIKPGLDESQKRTIGLYGKFIVKRTDGRDGFGQKHEKCQHFVLDVTHDPFAKPALLAYAKSCAKKYPLLAEDLKALFEPVRIRGHRRSVK